MAKSRQGEIDMKNTNMIKKIGTMILSSVMTSTMVVTPISAQEIEDNYPTEKTETVYVVLDENGSISEQIVSNWLHDEDGIQNIKEILNLSDVENVKTDEKPEVNGKEYTWNTDGNDVYYQGKSNQPLPINVKITYELNGKEVKASKLKGASGHLKIKVHYTNTESNTVTSNGKTFEVHPFYVAGGVLNFDNKMVSNVKCETGRIINDGTKQIVAFVSIPGLQDTFNSAGLEKVNDKLHISDECIIEADVKNYEQGELMIGMTDEISANSLSNMDDITSIYGELTPLFEGEQQLLDGAAKLSQGTQELATKAKPLTDASGQIEKLANGTVKLNEGTTYLQNSLTTYVNGVGQLNVGNQQLYGIPNTMQTGIAGAQGLVAGSESLMKGLETLNTQVQSLDLDSMKDFQDALALSKQQVESLQTNLVTSKKQLDTITTVFNGAMEQSQVLVENLNKLGYLLSEVNGTIQADNEKINAINGQIDTIVNQEQASITETVNALLAAKAVLNEENDPNGTQRAAIQAQIEAVSSLTNSIQRVENLQDLTAYLGQLQDICTNLSTTLQQFGTILKATNDSFNALQEQLVQANESLTMLEAIAAQANAQVSDLKLNDKIKALQEGVNALYEGSQALYGGTNQLNDGLKALYTASKAGIDQVNAGSNELASHNNEILAGLQQLQTGTSELAQNKDSLLTMAQGLTTLQDALDTLNTGAKTLYEGNQTFENQGMARLKELASLGDQEIETLQTIVTAIKDMKNESYSGAPENAKVSTRFIFRVEQNED